ncbi:MAG: hypothetical protein JWR85_4198 [Marmoricola sp.]|nr:hypothetical protein [Marmoricola sp.]
MGWQAMKADPLTHDELMQHVFFEHENGQVFLVRKTGLPTVTHSELKTFAFDLRGINNSVKTLLLGALPMYQTLHEIRNELLVAENAAADILPPNFEVDTRMMQLVDLTMALAREGLNATLKQVYFEASNKKT